MVGTPDRARTYNLRRRSYCALRLVHGGAEWGFSTVVHHIRQAVYGKKEFEEAMKLNMKPSPHL